LKIVCDSDWAADPETRISVTGCIVNLLDVSICWHSKVQKDITLSSTEVKHVAISEDVKEIKFVHYLQKDIHVNVVFPPVVKTDNFCTIFMSENALDVVRTRHIILSKNRSKMDLLNRIHSFNGKRL
jgi:hypothetical protein